MVSPALKNPTVKAAIDAFQRGDRTAWSALFEDGAELFDDGTYFRFHLGSGGRIHRLDVGQVE